MTYKDEFLKEKIEFAEEDCNDAAISFAELLDGGFNDLEIFKRYTEFDRCKLKLERLKSKL